MPGMVLFLLASDRMILKESPGAGVIWKVLLLVAGMICYYRPWNGGTEHLSMAGGLLMLAIGLATETFPKWTLALTGCVACLALISGALGFSLWVISQQKLTAVQSGSINNGMLIEIALLDMIFFAQRPTLLQWLGILAAFAAITLLRFRGKKALDS